MTVIVHIITALGAGGAERVLSLVASRLQKDTDTRHIVVSLADEGIYGAELRAAGVDVQCLHLKRGRFPVRGFFQLVRLLRDIRPDMVMTWLYHADLMGLLAARLAGIRNVAWNIRCTDIEFSQYSPITKLIVRALVYLSSLPAAIATNSFAGHRAHKELGYRARNWVWLPNGFDTELWRPDAADRTDVRRELGLSESDFVVGIVARVDPQKDHESFLRAAASLAPKYPNARFLLVGAGTPELTVPDACKASTIALGLRRDVPRLMRALDLLVCSSAYGEGFPNVCGEAMATGVPCVATDVGDSAFVIGDTGSIVPPRNAEALAGAIENHLLKPLGERQELAARARLRIDTNFSFQSCLQRYIAFFTGRAVALDECSSAASSAGTGPSAQRTADQAPLFEVNTFSTSTSSPAPKPMPSAKLWKKLLPVLVSLGTLALAGLYVAEGKDFGSIIATVSLLSWTTSASVLGLFVVASLLASVRLWLIARDIGSPISFRDATTALSTGSLAGLLFFQITGQTIARSALLARRGTPVPTTLVITAYERLLAMLISLALGAAGGIYLYGRLSLDLEQGGDELLKLAAVGVLALGAGAYLGWGRLASRRMPTQGKADFLIRALRNLALSAVIQLCTLLAYLTAAHDLAPDLDIIDVAAASAVVMLAASLPISFAGWGIREFSAVLALSAIGMASEKALVVALLAGTMSVVALVIVLAGCLLSPSGPRTTALDDGRKKQASFATSLGWILPLGAATLIFFQLYIPTAAGTKLNVNLADPFAIVGGSLFLLNAVSARNAPTWRLSHLNGHVVLATLVLTVGLVMGWTAIGFTAWAFTSKYLGWFVLLAYGATGALIVSTAGTRGRNTLLRTFIGAGIAVAAVDILLVVLKGYGVSLSPEIAPPRASGLAVNPNAFALQMVLVACATLIAIRSRRLCSALLAVCVLGVWFSGSRAGLGTLAAVMVASAMLLPDRRRVILAAIAAGLGFLVLLHLSYQVNWPEITRIASGKGGTVLEPKFAPIALSSDSSNLERWQTISQGLSLFYQHPVFGSGLGVFAENWRAAQGQIQVIHSTPLWLLAEFGIVGTLVFLVPFLRISVQSLRAATQGQRVAVLTFLCCLVFAIMAMAHEVFYQRAIWLLLGVTLALAHGAIAWPFGAARHIPAEALGRQPSIRTT
jgi:glycosyltransferase involved in cell wall biosynthesis